MNKELVLTVVVRKELDRYSAWCPELDVASEGDTIEEARESLKEAVECHVEAMITQGDTELLFEKLGISKERQKKNLILPESYSGTFEIPISV